MLNMGERGLPSELWVPLVPMQSSDMQRQNLNRALKNSRAHSEEVLFFISLSMIRLCPLVAGWLWGPCDLCSSSSSPMLRSLTPAFIH